MRVVHCDVSGAPDGLLYTASVAACGGPGKECDIEIRRRFQQFPHLKRSGGRASFLEVHLQAGLEGRGLERQ